MKTKSIIPFVPSLAFVCPVYDYRGPDDLCPSIDWDTVGFAVYGFDVSRHSWKRVGFYDAEFEAEKIAQAYHWKMRGRLPIADHVTSPTFDVPDELRLYEEGDPIEGEIDA